MPKPKTWLPGQNGIQEKDRDVRSSPNGIYYRVSGCGLICFEPGENLKPQKKQIVNTWESKGNFPLIANDAKEISELTARDKYQSDSKNSKLCRIGLQRHSSEAKSVVDGICRPASPDSAMKFYPLFPPEIRRVEIFNNNETRPLQEGKKIAHNLNNIRFSFLVQKAEDVVYQYRLLNASSGWSAWDKTNTIAFLNLPGGSYTLEIRAKQHDIKSGIRRFSFSVATPWYSSRMAIAGYLVLILALLIMIVRWQKSKFGKLKKELIKREENLQLGLAEKNRQEIMLEQWNQLEIEKNILTRQIRNKTLELAKKSKDDDDKNRLLHLLKEKIHEAESNPSITRIRWSEMRRLLDSHLETEDKTFEIQMDELHQEFFKTLKEKHPSLSIYDLRLCAYLKIGISSKEMAEMLQVLPSSLYVSRSRLRKKLNLSADEDLYNYLNHLD